MDGQDWKQVVLTKTPKIVKVNPPSLAAVKDEDGLINKPKMFTPEFGRRIEQFRTAKGMCRADLAQKLNVKTNVIENLEKGKELYNGNLLSKLKRILGNDL